MGLPYNPKLKAYARTLRRVMTDAENILWAKIRRKQLHGRQFYRQKNVGNYIVDFYCPSAKLIIEVDGGQHYTDDGMQKDKERGACLKSLGFTVMRFSDMDVIKNTPGVIEAVYDFLEKSLPTSL